MGTGIFQINGVSVMPYAAGAYASPDVFRVIRQAKADGANYVALGTSIGVNPLTGEMSNVNINSTNGVNASVPLSDLAAVAVFAKSLGLGVMIKPQFHDQHSGNGLNNLQPINGRSIGDVPNFFKNYQSQIVGIAKIAAATGSEILSIGNESPIATLPLQIPTEAGRVFRFDVGHHSDLKPATVPR